MPTNCWNTARPMPTINARRSPGRRSSRSEAFFSSSMVWRMSSSSCCFSWPCTVCSSAALEHTVHGQEKQQELDDIRQTIEEEKKASLRELLRPGLRLALIVGIGLAVFQQLVGINTVIYYAPTIFSFAGFGTASAAILATSIVGVVNVLATILSLFLVDRLGRRPLLIGGIGGMVLTLIAMGTVFLFDPRQAGWFVLICMLIYIAAFAIGMGPVFWLMTSELFPNRLRGTGASVSSLFNWATNLLVSITF